MSIVVIATLASCGAPYDGDLAVEPTSGDDSSVQSELQGAWQSSRTYRVTVHNVTADNGLSPSLVVASTNDFRLFELGAAAKPGIAAIAETGATDVLQNELSSSAKVRGVAKANGGPIPAGQKREIEITLPKGSRSQDIRLNIISMIGRSNDSFVSTPTGIELSRCDDASMTVALTNFDSGSEENTGNVEDFGPGGHPVAQAEGLISYDRGLNLRGNAPERFGWGSTAGLVTVTRIR